MWAENHTIGPDTPERNLKSKVLDLKIVKSKNKIVACSVLACGDGCNRVESGIYSGVGSGVGL